MKKIKSLSQNFLKNQYFLKLISQVLEIEVNNTVIEIGGGNGELTKYLQKTKKLIVYEIDKNLAEKLKKKFPQVEIKNENFLNADLEKFNHQYKLVGNIPYSISGLILRKVLNLKNYPQIFVLTLQKEFGEKILTEGEFLNKWVRIWANVKKIAFISKKYFFPQPKVDSLILKMKFYQKPLVSEPEKFVKFLKEIYKQPKKMLKNKIKLATKYQNLASLRAHQLSFKETLELFNYYF